MMPEKNIQVSICCLVYNHEPYLRQCLDGFMMQKDISFEVLIHDDASTDHSADIIREYEAKYPDIIKPIYQTENQYSKGIRISSVFQYPRAKGKYIALCEGDDYWTDPYKLKKQFDAMEGNPQCRMCVHGVITVTPQGEPNGRLFPTRTIKDTIISSKKFIRYFDLGAPFQTSCFFFDAEDLKKYSILQPTFSSVSPVGDAPLALYFGYLGSVFYIHDYMSCYRSGCEGSWTSIMQNNEERQILADYKMIASCDEFFKFTNGKYRLNVRKSNALIDILLKSKKYGDLFKSIHTIRAMLISERYGLKFAILCFIRILFPTFKHDSHPI